MFWRAVSSLEEEIAPVRRKRCALLSGAATYFGWKTYKIDFIGIIYALWTSQKKNLSRFFILKLLHYKD